MHREDGTALVELALVLPVLIVLVMGILEFGRAINYWLDANQLANTAARWAAVDKNPGADDSLSLQEYTRLQADTAELRDSAEVCVNFPDSEEVGDPVEVIVKADFEWLPVLGLDAVSTTLRGSATMRLEQLPSEFSEDASCS